MVWKNELGEYVVRQFNIKKELLSEFRGLVYMVYGDKSKGAITKEINMAIENRIKILRAMANERLKKTEIISLR